MSTNKKTLFNSNWLLKDTFKTWVAPVEKDRTSAHCKLCCKNFDLSNMGEQALVSHMNGKKHQKAYQSSQCSSSLYAFYASKKSSLSSQNVQNVSISTEIKDVSDQSKPTCKETADSTSVSENVILTTSNQTSANQPRGLKSMLIKNEITKAEVLWCLHLVQSHNSQRSGGDAVNLFRIMFPDSEVASAMKLQRTKIAYTVNFGLAPYFFRSLQDLCNKSEYLVIGFDESLNKVAQKGQMDVFVRFWDRLKNQVSTRYYGSSFLGHATASDLLSSFLDASKGLEISKLLQVSMDGPNVNKKFLLDLKSKRKEENPDGAVLLNLGSCGLHTVHNSYKKSMKVTGWGISEILRALYYLFCYSPARRNDYTTYSGSCLFPLKFCAVRWVENFNVAGRAAIIWPNVQKYVQGMKDTKKMPECNSFKIVSSAVEDKFLPAKLAFFQMMASEVEPFLKKFQTNEPLSPLLYEQLQGTLRNIMSRFVKEDVLKSLTNFASVDFKTETNLISTKIIDLGFSVKTALRKLNQVKDIDVLRFKNDCRKALIEFCTALLKNSPMNYPLTKGISCFDPEIAKRSSVRISRLDKALEVFVQNNWVSGVQADNIKRSYKTLCKEPLFEEAMTHFSCENQRLDDFWMDIIPNAADFEALRSFLKMVLILSHGNAFCETGFSINKEMLIENLSEESLVFQRRVYDSIQYHGGVTNIEISKSLIHFVRNARDTYQEALKRKQDDTDAKLKEQARKRQNTDKLKTLEQKKRKLLDDTRKKIEEVDTEIKTLI